MIIFLIYSVIFCEAVAIYGVIMAIIMQGKMTSSDKSPIQKDYDSGYALFWTGFSVGISNLVCGVI